jgi:hypothetical protein
MLSTNESAGMAGTPCALIKGIAVMIQIRAAMPKCWHRVKSILIIEDCTLCLPMIEKATVSSVQRILKAVELLYTE